MSNALLDVSRPAACSIHVSIGSKVLVIRPRAALWRHPSDDLVGILDVAGLAVDAVGGVDLQAPAAAAIGAGIVDDLVHARRTEAGTGVVVFGGAAGDADRGVVDDEVDGLVLVVLGGGEIDAGEAVAGSEVARHVIALWRFLFADLVECRPVGLVLQRPWRMPAGRGFP